MRSKRWLIPTVMVTFLAAIVVVAMEQKALGDKLARRVRRYAALAMVPVLAVAAWLLALGSQFGTSAVSVAAPAR